MQALVPNASMASPASHDARRPAAPTLEEEIRARAFELGFDVCRFARADVAPEQGERLRAWLRDGAHGDMAWMRETAERRAAPRALWPEAASLVMLGLNYGPDGDPLASLTKPDCATISVYARNRDYHDVIKGRLKQLAGFILSRAGAGDAKVFVDTAPVMEKPLAQTAGVGWQGKHTNLVSRDFGSWLFLGAIFTTLRLEPDPPERDHCGSCSKCLDVCPTAAFPAPYRLDARRCISYLTIEHKGPIPLEFRAKIGNRIYGCDDCLAVCPWNKYASAGREAKLAARPEFGSPPLAELARLDDAAFRALFAGSPNQTHRTRPLLAQCSDRDRQFSPARTCRRSRAADRRRRRHCSRRRRLGARQTGADASGGAAPRSAGGRTRRGCQPRVAPNGLKQAKAPQSPKNRGLSQVYCVAAGYSPAISF